MSWSSVFSMSGSISCKLLDSCLALLVHPLSSFWRLQGQWWDCLLMSGAGRLRLFSSFVSLTRDLPFLTSFQRTGSLLHYSYLPYFCFQSCLLGCLVFPYLCFGWISLMPLWQGTQPRLPTWKGILLFAAGGMRCSPWTLQQWEPW